MQRHGLVQRVAAQQVQDGRKGLAADHRRLRRHRHQGRCGIERRIGRAGGPGAFATQHRAAFGPGLVQRGLHRGKGLAVHQRADQHPGLARVAHGQTGTGQRQTLGQRVVDAALRNHAPGAGAPLAGGAPGAKGDAAHGQVQIRAGRDDHRVVAAQLQQAAAETRRHARGDRAAHAGRAGGRDQGHARVVHQRLAQGRAAIQNLAQR